MAHGPQRATSSTSAASLADAAAAGGEAMVDAAERLATSLDAAVRMALLEALSDAAAEITAALDGPSVEVRLRGRDPDFVVTPAPPPTSRRSPRPPAASVGAPDPTPTATTTATARITLRIPEGLKQRAESPPRRPASRSTPGSSTPSGPPPTGRRRPSRRPPARVGKQLSGWVALTHPPPPTHTDHHPPDEEPIHGHVHHPQPAAPVPRH